MAFVGVYGRTPLSAPPKSPLIDHQSLGGQVMQRNEKIILIRETPEALVDALDGIMRVQGFHCIALRTVTEDWTPLVTTVEGPTVFVISQSGGEWTTCFSSLAPDEEWTLSEALAASLQQPTVYALIHDAAGVYAYRYFEDGMLREEFDPATEQQANFGAAELLERLASHTIPLDLIDDRILNVGQPHLVVAYAALDPTSKGS